MTDAVVVPQSSGSTPLPGLIAPGTVTPAPSPIPVAEPGYATSEFWITIGGEVVAFLFASGALTQAQAIRITGLISMGVGTVFYAVSRGIRKKGTTA